MREVTLSRPGLPVAAATFLACVATILEVEPEALPELRDEQDPAADWLLSGWLGTLGVGMASVADPGTFAWAGPWIARLREPDGGSRCVVMFGRTPSGVVWDPAGDGEIADAAIEAGFLIAAEDIALALPARAAQATGSGTLEEIWVAPTAGEPVQPRDAATLIAGVGIDGDRYTSGSGSFPSGRPGAALTLIEHEVCGSFEPPLRADEHRRNLVTRGIRLDSLLGSEFRIGGVLCRGIRPCEPCATMQRYAQRPLLRALVHRGGVRADILENGEIRTGDAVIPAP